MYFNNHTHSEYSNAQLGFADCTNKIKELIDTAYNIGLAGFTLTDHEGIMGHIEALKYYNECKTKWERPFKLGLGNEIYCMSQQEYEYNQTLADDSIPYYHLILTALDTEGHYQLRQLSDRAWDKAKTIKSFMRKPTFYSDIEQIINQNRGHIACSTACMGGYLGKSILKWRQTKSNEDKAAIHHFITWGINTFGHSDFYLEIQPCDGIHNIDQNIVNETMLLLAEAYHLKIIVTTDVHYLQHEDRFVHETLLKSKEGDREVEEFYSTAYLMNESEITQYLLQSEIFTQKQVEWILSNTMELCDKIQEYHLDHVPIIPEIPKQYIEPFEIQHTFKEWYDKYPAFKYYATEADYLHDRYFFYRIEKALQEKIADKGLDIETYIDRCNTEMNELKIISANFQSSMASYYSTFKNIVQLIWDSGSLSMPSRGSAMGYVICYLLDITQIDPVPLGDYTPYWRHLSSERQLEIADIDNDSQASKRELILENLKKYFGYDKVLSVATVSKLTARTAIEKSVKGLNLNDDLAGYLKTLIPVERGSIWSIHDCLYGDGKNRKPITEFINEINKYEHLRECVESLENLVINRGIHASGILITNEPYTKLISSMRSPTGLKCTSYNLHDTEWCGGTKIDLLTVQAADKIAATMDLLIKHNKIQWQGSLQATYNKYLHPDVIKYDDDILWHNISDVYSIFQFNTDVSIKALKEVQPHSIMDLSAANSLLRLQVSGDEQPIEQYRRYKNDITEWEKDCIQYGLNQHEMEILKKYLSDSYMMADCQEKIMRLSMDKEIAGFGLKESNLLRKSISKKSPEQREKSRKQFYEWGEKLGTRKIFLDYVWNEVFGKSFGYVGMLMCCEPYQGCVA